MLGARSCLTLHFHMFSFVVKYSAQKDENSLTLISERLSVLEVLHMTCKEFSSMLPGFLDDTLDNDSLRLFLNHLDECGNCKEELEIQYLVKRVFDEKSLGEELNLSKDLPAFIEKERDLLRRRRRLSVTAAVFESVAIVAAIVTAILYMI